jgi:outer membrane receptor protein involved in Fe transport
VPLGNAIGATELDIESVEITPGAASALYGMNAINGIANLQTKSPFKYQGLSVYQKVGVNHVDGKDRDPSALTETAIRYAKAFNNRFAFKLNFSTLQGTDWVANGLTDQNPQISLPPIRVFQSYPETIILLLTSGAGMEMTGRHDRQLPSSMEARLKLLM